MITLTKGEADTIEFTANKDITDWEIRAIIYPKNGLPIKKANILVSYGSNDQIFIDKTETHKFYLNLTEKETSKLSGKIKFELELESPTHDTVLFMTNDMLVTNT